MNVIIICGPTASGKTALSIALAKRLQSSIINCDSMQIYKHLDIGSAKATEEEQAMVRHHMLDIVEPNENFSVQKYQERVLPIIRQENEEGRVPIVVGGTGLYIQSILSPLDFQKSKPDPSLRRELEGYSAKELYEKLIVLNQKAAEKTDPHNKRRLIRALEVAHAGEEKASSFREDREDLKALIYGLDIPRPLLHTRIKQRVEIMLEDGLLREVNDYLFPALLYSQAGQGIGYNEVMQYFKGLATYEEMKRLIVLHTRQYAKRQMTWFRRVENLQWLDGLKETNHLVDQIMEDYTNVFR